MTSQEFIFSNKTAHRISRHVALWLVFSLHFIIQNLIIGTTNEALKTRTFGESVFNLIHFLPVYIISTYIFTLWVMPVFLFRRRLTLFFIVTFLLLITAFIACYSSGLLYIHFQTGKPISEINFGMNKYHAVVNGIFLPLMILGISGGIKAMKTWYQKQRENEILAAQKIAAEIQLLKIQINPRFLFHSLTTIKENIQAGSPHSPELILKIADMLSYVLYESDKEQIPLAKELDIIKDYLDLEIKSSIGRITGEVVSEGDFSDIDIAPLILLTLCETVLEHLLGTKMKNTSVTIAAAMKDGGLRFRLNTLSEGELFYEFDSLAEKLQGIKLQLQSYYPGNHQLEIIISNQSVTINVAIVINNKTGAGANAVNLPNEMYEPV